MENKRTEAKSSYHVGGMSIVFVQLVLSVLFFGAGKRERNDSGKISGADRGRSFGVFGKLRLVYSF